jgi:hypothetical protein
VAGQVAGTPLRGALYPRVWSILKPGTE